jgi:hypothetical protein
MTLFLDRSFKEAYLSSYCQALVKVDSPGLAAPAGDRAAPAFSGGLRSRGRHVARFPRHPTPYKKRKSLRSIYWTRPPRARTRPPAAIFGGLKVAGGRCGPAAPAPHPIVAPLAPLLRSRCSRRRHLADFLYGTTGM